MPLPKPILDDRSYQQLRDELIRRIPVYTPEWTDHNPSDPGITLIELFSFLGENLLFRFNQIPEAAKLAFLRLLQVPLRPKVPSRALVTMTSEAPDGVLVLLGSEAKAGSVLFETTTEVKVYPVRFAALGRIASPAPDKSKEPEVFDFAVRALDAIQPLDPDQKPVYYHNETVPPDANGLPVDFDAAVDGTLWIAVIREKRADISKMGGAVLNVGFVPDPVVPTIDEVEKCPGTDRLPTNPP